MPADGSDFAQNDVCGYQDVNEIKNSYVGASAPSFPVTGCLWEDTSGGSTVLKIHDTRWAQVRAPKGHALVGMIVTWCPGYFTDGSNGGYTRVLGTANTVAGANAYLNARGWYVCDGAVPNYALSAIWNAAGRYLPNLTDDRFVMGDSTAGGTGGSSANSHTHDCDPTNVVSTTESATILINTSGSGEIADNDHAHDVDIDSKTSTAATVTENRPLFLSCFYIAKVY